MTERVTTNDSEPEIELRAKIGQMLRKRRQDQGLSSKALLRKMGLAVPRSTLYYYEKSGPSPEALRFLRIFACLGMSLEEVFGDCSVSKYEVALSREMATHMMLHVWLTGAGQSQFERGPVCLSDRIRLLRRMISLRSTLSAGNRDEIK
jgi:transcriptional regulator with XRE-family HTH domain